MLCANVLHMMCVVQNLCHLLNGQKQNQCSVCKDTQKQAKNDTNVISTVITGDESWVYG